MLAGPVDERDKPRVGEQIEPAGRQKAPGRLATVQRFLYHDVTRLPLTLPTRPASRGYERPPRDTQTYVPDRAASLLG
jgi:hypothetical protein